MQEELNSNPRADFLKKASLVLISVFGLGLLGYGSHKQTRSSIHIFKKLSNNEADDVIKDLKSSGSGRIKPEPPPEIRQEMESKQEKI
jgi:hypothetical protein